MIQSVSQSVIRSIDQSVNEGSLPAYDRLTTTALQTLTNRLVSDEKKLTKLHKFLLYQSLFRRRYISIR